MTETEAYEAVTILFDTWYPAAVRYAYRLSGRQEIAEDCVQETFLRLYKELCAGKTVENPKGWSLAVIRVQVRIRMAKLRTEAAGGDLTNSLEQIPDPSEAQDVESPEEVLRQLCTVLTKREEEVLFLRLAEMKYKEIATVLGISSSSVNTLLARALRKLQQSWTRQAGLRTAANHAESIFPKTLQ
ncbi:MAG: sigma-70 family RNA polymerase sigma factor [Bryobacteraceae bacterium]